MVYTGVLQVMPELSRDQQAALNALGWLFSSSPSLRGSGRTTVLAIALIRCALAHPGQRFTVTEARHRPPIDNVLQRTILGMVNSDSRLTDRFRNELLLSARQPFLCFDGPALPSAETWLPRGWRAPPPPRMAADVTLQDLEDLIADAPHLLVPADPEAEFRAWAARDAARAAPPPPPEAERPQTLWQRLKED